MYEGKLVEMAEVAELEEGDEIIIRDALQLYMTPKADGKVNAVTTPPRSRATIMEIEDGEGGTWLKFKLKKEDAKRMGGKSKVEGWATNWQLGAAGCFDYGVNVKADC